MSEISGSGDIQSWRQESETAELVAGQPIEGAVDKVASGYDQTNSVSQSQTEKADYFLAPRVIPVPTLQAALQGVMVASSEDIKGLLSKALVSRESLEQRSAGEEAESLSVVASNVSPSVANTGSLALQRVIDDIVSINRNSGRASGNGAQSVQQNRSDLYEMTEHVQLKLLSQSLGIDLNPLIRTGEGRLEGILVIQRGVLLAIDAMSNAEFMEVLKERLREEQVKEDQIKEDQIKSDQRRPK
ncbi:hypothetical protein [Endozoicomonas sp. SCSIO W0465]|uniref:hypothetical protein n=1 Tax=Endozoicomonas sp. SCSIO W0465 TaxID=2918516 RepID=UPI002074E388|nr:hypothetical protein [Endozoicomonas sp. SCSIO W0465]USE39354.1 hypothetical protein MJO57_15040 [Endozoicomonas sp. SCSIO W0465]